MFLFLRMRRSKTEAALIIPFVGFICSVLVCCSVGYDEHARPLASADFCGDTFRVVAVPSCHAYSIVEEQLYASGLVNIQEVDSSIRVDLKYAGADNLFKRNVYGTLRHAFLQPDIAERLTEAQKYLKELQPGYSLVIYDAARPMSIQQMLWDSLRVPGREKGKYVSNPKHGGSLHNYGAAVDASIIDHSGAALDMGCPFDHFGELAYPASESKLLASGELKVYQVANRKLLRKVMYHAGFFNIQTEWWHFNACRRERAIELYGLIE
jgi:zinc D-Ala-D-Ala dipeptidase